MDILVSQDTVVLVLVGTLVIQALVFLDLVVIADILVLEFQDTLEQGYQDIVDTPVSLDIQDIVE